MKTIIPACILILFCAVASRCQQTQTINYPLLTTPDASFSYLSPQLRNNGQTQHQLIITFGDQPSLTCTNPNFSVMDLKGRNTSSDELATITTNRIVLSRPNVPAARIIYAVYGFGAFRELRAAVNWASDCQIQSIWYSGTLYPLAVEKDKAAQIEMRQVTVTCGAGSELLAPPEAGAEWALYGLMVEGGNVAGDFDLQLISWPDTITPLYFQGHVQAQAAGPIFVLPLSPLPYLKSNRGGGFFADCSTATSMRFTVWRIKN